MFKLLNQINSKPKPFEYYTVKELWTDKHTSKKMLETHLDDSVDMASYKFEFIDKSVDWIESFFQLTSKSKIADFGCGPGLYTTRLAEKGIRLVGVDYLSVAPFRDPVPTHKILLEQRIVILEGLDLHHVPPGRYSLYCLPLKLLGCDGAPARAVLVGV